MNEGIVLQSRLTVESAVAQLENEAEVKLLKEVCMQHRYQQFLDGNFGRWDDQALLDEWQLRHRAVRTFGAGLMRKMVER